MALGSYSAGHFKSAQLFTLGHPTAEAGCHTWYKLPTPGHQAWLTTPTPTTDGWDDPTLEPAVWVNVATPDSEVWVPEPTTPVDWDAPQLNRLVIQRTLLFSPLYHIESEDTAGMSDAYPTGSIIANAPTATTLDAAGMPDGFMITSGSCIAVLKTFVQSPVDSAAGMPDGFTVLSGSCIVVLKTFVQSPVDSTAGMPDGFTILSGACNTVLLTHVQPNVDSVAGMGGLAITSGALNG